MGLFGKKKEKVLDWSENYRIPEKRTTRNSSRNNGSSSSSSDMEFLGDMASSSASNSSNSSSNDYVSWDNDTSVPVEHEQEHDSKKTKIAKRLLDMTDKIEDLSNQVYHLKQRIELLEKKLKINFD
jgi:hypothetical protein